MNTIDTLEARRLALCKGGLLNAAWGGMPEKASGSGKRASRACQKIIERFGYLQLDTVAVAGARSHAIVLLSRLRGLDRLLPEQLLYPGGLLFEYWGHEASWIPLALYPAFEFRRRAFRRHPWWGDVLAEYPRESRELLRAIEKRGPMRSLDLEGKGSNGWWNHKLSKRIASALWSCGDLAIRSRENFQRSFDLPERVISQQLLQNPLTREESLDRLLLRALKGHGWASTGTLNRTWRLKNLQSEIAESLRRLKERGEIAACALWVDSRTKKPGWIRCADRELAARLRRVRPRRDQGVLLSPFDPVLWDRERVMQLFGFEQCLEIFKPQSQRQYGYYCMPVLAGDRLIARVDLKAYRREGRLSQLTAHIEASCDPAEARQASDSALLRYSDAVELRLDR